MSCGCQLSVALCLAVGTSPSWVFTVVDPDESNTAVDISGATFEFYVKEAWADDDADAVFSLTSAADEIVITDAASGQAQIDNDAAKSSLLSIGRFYYWSLRITFPSGETRVIGSGSLEATAA